jgi:hypothetical protein
MFIYVYEQEQVVLFVVFDEKRRSKALRIMRHDGQTGEALHICEAKICQCEMKDISMTEY